MGSVQKHTGTKNYYAHYTLPNGKRKAVSTGTDDIFEARQILNKLEQAANLATKKELTRRRAFKLINEIAEASGCPIFEEESTESFLDRWLHAQSVKPATRKGYTSLIEDFKTFLGDRKKESALFISPRDCNGFKQWLIDKGLADSTINGHISTMTAIFGDAEKQQLIDVNPFKSVSRIKKAKRAQKKAFTLAQFKSLIDKTEGEWKTLIMIAGLSGQRQKNNDRFTVPMHPKLSAYLKKIESTPEGYIMPVMAKRPATGRESISDLFRNQILPLIGIVQRYGGTKGSGRTVSQYSFHSLRHSLSTWLNEIGVSETDRMRIVGHADKKISQQYIHTEIEKVKESLNRISV